MGKLQDSIGLPPKAREIAAEPQADSVAADVPTLVADFNSLLAKLRAAGLLKE